MPSIRISDAPGCIGSPIIRNEAHPICVNCEFKNVCRKLARVNAERLKEELGLSMLSENTGKKLTKGTERYTIAELESPKYENKRPLTVKGKQTTDAIFKRVGGVEVVRNAMKLTSRTHVQHALQNVSLDWALECLLLIWDNAGSLKKKDLRDYVTNELGYSRTMAIVYVSNFINATTNADFIIEDKEKLSILYENPS